METIEELKIHYQWRPEEQELLNGLSWFGEKYQEEWIEGLYSYLANFKDTSKYLPDENVRERHKTKLKQWFVALFEGAYGVDYLRYLYHVGEVHVRIGLPPHYVSASMNYVRQFILKKLTFELGASAERDRLMESVHNILDLNLDIMTSSYREEELKLYLASGRVQRSLIENMRRLSWFFDFFIILAFSLAGLFLIGWISREVLMVLTAQADIQHGALNIMGSVLILYAISELLAEEIKHLRGGALGIDVFVAVALAAVIRKILVISLETGRAQDLLVLALLILTLGATYWLIGKVETRA